MSHSDTTLPLVRRRTLGIFLIWWFVALLIAFVSSAALARHAPRVSFGIWAVVCVGGFCVYAVVFLKVWYVRCAACGDYFYKHWYGMTPWALFHSRCVHCGYRPERNDATPGAPQDSI